MADDPSFADKKATAILCSMLGAVWIAHEQLMYV
jgi:hypothetical protein